MPLISILPSRKHEDRHREHHRRSTEQSEIAFGTVSLASRFSKDGVRVGPSASGLAEAKRFGNRTEGGQAELTHS